MSGYTENHIGHNGTLDRGITLLQKPFTLPALKAKVREVLDTPPPKEIQMSARLAQAAPIARTRNKISSPFRATRFDLHLPLKYRQVGESGWREGTTENISRSGMLFQAEECIAPNAQLEINLVLPAEIAGSGRGRSCLPGRSRTHYRFTNRKGHADTGSKDPAIPFSARIAAFRGMIKLRNQERGWAACRLVTGKST